MSGRRFSSALRDAVARSGMSARQLAALVTEAGHPVSTAALNYWMTGRSQPRRRASLSVVAELERVLDINGGTLLNLLDAGEDAWRFRAEPLAPLGVHDAEVEQLRAEWGIPWNDGLRRVLQLSTVVIHAGGERDQATKLLVTADRAGADRMIMFLVDSPVGPQEARFVPPCGCRIERVKGLGDLTANEVVFDRPLAAGESLLIEYQEARPLEPSTRQWAEARSTRPTESLAVQVKFLGTPPRWVVRSRARGLSEEGSEVRSEDPQLVLGQTIQTALRKSLQGRVRLDWSFDDHPPVPPFPA